MMYPGLEHAYWRRRHLVPRPGLRRDPEAQPRRQLPAALAGAERRGPVVRVSETFRSRGIGVDRAARAALTVVEDYLGRRIAGFEETWRY